MEYTIKIDQEHSIRIVCEDDGTPALGTTYHPNQDGEPCFGTVEFSEDEWKLVKTSPLTISPSIVCAYCDSHAIISGGKWIEYWKSTPPEDNPLARPNYNSQTSTFVAWLKHALGL